MKSAPPVFVLDEQIIRTPFMAGLLDYSILRGLGELFFNSGFDILELTGSICPTVDLSDFMNQINLSIVDPWADPDEVSHEYQIKTLKKVPDQKFDAVILAVGHNEFKNLPISDYLNEVNVVYDVKGLFDKKIVDGRL